MESTICTGYKIMKPKEAFFEFYDRDEKNTFSEANFKKISPVDYDAKTDVS